MIADIPAEEAVLGGVLLKGAIPPSVIDAGLRPEHFYRPEHREAFEFMLKKHDEGEPIDPLTLPSAERYAGSVPAVWHLPAYAKSVVDKARWRTRYAAAVDLIGACELSDEDAFAVAESKLTIPSKTSGVYDRDMLGRIIVARLEDGPETGYPVPFFTRKLRPKTVTLVGGWTSHGKTVFVDQWARALHLQGADVWMWLNEMTAEERMNRHVSASTGIPLERVEEGRLVGDEYQKVARSLNEIPFQLVECPGWGVEDIARDIRVRKPDIAVIDILHRIPYRDERDLARISQVLGDCAKLADCALIATVHLNEKRVMGAARPQPTLGDIKGASALKQDADNVMFVWREDDPVTGFPSNVGQVYYAKARQGKLGGVEVAFDGEHARFEERWPR